MASSPSQRALHKACGRSQGLACWYNRGRRCECVCRDVSLAMIERWPSLQNHGGVGAAESVAVPCKHFRPEMTYQSRIDVNLTAQQAGEGSHSIFTQQRSSIVFITARKCVLLISIAEHLKFYGVPSLSSPICT